MELRTVLHLPLLFGVFHKGLSALIETQKTVVAAVGQEAQLSCRLIQTKDVHQVTWQKIYPEEVVNVATYNTDFGRRVTRDFRDRVEFTEAGLQNCSIVLRKVTQRDEGCYLCMFNTYPDGALTGKTCLQLFELHGAVLHVRESNSSEEAVVSCSATARPPPTVTLRVRPQDLHLSNHSSVTVTNTNGTVTVTTTAVLSGLRGNSTQVGCAVRVLSGPQMEMFKRIPESRPLSDDVFYVESEPDQSDLDFTLIVSVCVSVVVCVCVAAVVALLLIRKHRNRDPEMKTPRKTSESTESKTPLFQHENEALRQRSSIKKREESNDPNAFPSSPNGCRQLFPTTP